MVTTNTHHGLMKLFKETLLAWRRGSIDSVDTRIYPQNIQEAFCEQTQIGWTNFVVGQWSKKWQAIQGDYYKMVKSQQSAKRWATAIIWAPMNIYWDVWDFRNTQTHGKDSPMERKLHRSLNLCIRQEYVEGYADLLPIDKHWLRDQTYCKLKKAL